MSNLAQQKVDKSFAGCVSQAVRLNTALRADYCKKWLKSQGYEVLYVLPGMDKPRVFIKNSPLCDKLDGAVHRFERCAGVEHRYWFAIRHDCEVRWNDAQIPLSPPFAKGGK